MILVAESYLEFLSLFDQCSLLVVLVHPLVQDSLGEGEGGGG